jgi:hypothetical protein
MPDFNKYAADVPNVRPEQVIGLSQIVQPKYDYVNTFPPTADLNSGASPEAAQQNTKGFWEKDSKKLNQLFGGVPTSPGAVTPYNEAKRYNSDTLGFLPDRDNEDLYAEKQGFFNSVGSGLGRLVGLTVTKTGTGLGYLAGLVGVGNDSEKYGSGFGAWIAGAGDNGISKWFQSIEDDKIKTDWLPIYQKASEKDHGLFRSLGDLDTWTDKLVDGAAFMVGAFVPGMAISKLKLGANVIEGLSALQGIGRTEEAAALATEGVSGTVASKALETEGLGATIETPETAGTIRPEKGATFKMNGGVPTGADALQHIPRALKWINNAKLARSIDVGATSIINTASQAMYSANDSKNNAYQSLINQKDQNGNNKYSVEQANQISAKVARDNYLMNLGALSLMNLWEANFMFKKPNLSNTFGKQEFGINGLFGDATLAKQTFGERAYSVIKGPAKGVLTTGVWLGNMQLAIDRLNNNPDNFNLDFGDKLKAVGRQYVTQLGNAIVGDDPEAAKSIGIGGLLGGIAGKLLGHNENKEVKKNLSELNKQVSAFREIGNIYKTDDAGKLILEDGNPALDQDKVKSWVASFNKILSLNQVGKSFEKRGVNEMAKLYGDEVFSRFAKAHFDSGMGDLLYQKLRDVSGISKEDLALLGFDPDSKNKETTELLNNYTKKAQNLEELYNNIHGNYVSTDIPNTKAGQKKQFDITDKMFYLSARSQTLSEIIKNSKDTYERVKANADTFNQSFNSLTDGVVDQYNELFENTYSAGKQPPIHPDLYEAEADYTKINQTRDESKDKLDDFVKNNKEVLEKLKKDSRGRYMYEIANKNLLPSAKEMERQQIVQAETTLARNATMNVLSRLADPKFGVKYYDQVYSKELERHAQESGTYDDITKEDDVATKQTKEFYADPKKDLTKLSSTVTPEEVNDAYAQAVDENKIDNKEQIADYIAEKISKGQKLTDQEEVIRKSLGQEVEDNLQKRAKKSDLNELGSQMDDLIRQRDALEGKEDRSADEETDLENLNNQIEALQDQRDAKFDEMDVQDKVASSPNIKPEDREKYNDVLNKINREKKRVVKFDDRYQVDGQDYRKVTDLIGDTISDEQRQDPRTQAAVSIGNTIDSVTKAYFANGLTQEFKDSVSDKMTPETFTGIVKSLDKLKADLERKGINIVSSNVFVTDPTLKVAGEIDLLGVDKNGNFKIYEIQARRGDVYRQYGKRGLGVKLRDIDGKRLSMYRNMFANQYGSIPDEIAVKFPFEVKYDKTNPNGFIENAKIREEIRFNPLKNVEIKMKNAEPLRIGSKYSSVDMNRIFLDTFLPTKESGDKLKFLFRNISLKELTNGMKLTVREALPEFKAKYELQRKALAKEPVDFNIRKFRDYKNKDEQGNPREFPNLYSLVGNVEMGLTYDGTPAGYMSPVETMAYKDIDGNFKILDENTDIDTYSEVTGNDKESYNEFRRIAAAYKKLHTELTNRMRESPNHEITLSNDELRKLVDLKPSVGELDLVKGKDQRPDLKDIAFSGVKIGGKSIPTVANIDNNDAVKILMDKGRKSSGLLKKYQEVDRWANAHINDLKAAMFDKNGTKVTSNVAIVESPSGDYKIVSLKAKGDFNPDNHEDFVDGLGSKFTAATTKNVFKNENIMVVPKQTDEVINLDLKEHQIVSKVYETDDIDTLEKYGLNPSKITPETTDTKIDQFLTALSDKDRQTLDDFSLNTKESIRTDFEQGDWSSIDDYIDNIKNCK